MATLIQAVNAYRPRVVHKEAIGLERIIRRLSQGSLFTESIARLVLSDLSGELCHQLRTGHVVGLPGIGRFRMHMGTGGVMRPTMRVDRGLKKALRDPATFRGKIERRENVGLTTEEIVALWDAEHPEDPVIWPPNGRSRSSR